MHLNIPPHNETQIEGWWRNIKWGLMGIFGPELVVFTAWRQYNSAKALQAKVNEQLGLAEAIPSGKKRIDSVRWLYQFGAYCILIFARIQCQ